MLRDSIAIGVPNLVVIRVLGVTRTPTAARHLVAALGDASVAARFHGDIGRALGTVGDPTILPDLESLATAWKDDASRADALREVIGRLKRR